VRKGKDRPRVQTEAGKPAGELASLGLVEREQQVAGATEHGASPNGS
jgi:hypothetical protein